MRLAALALVAAGLLYFAGWGSCVFYTCWHVKRGGSAWDLLPWARRCVACGGPR